MLILLENMINFQIREYETNLKINARTRVIQIYNYLDIWEEV